MTLADLPPLPGEAPARAAAPAMPPISAPSAPPTFFAPAAAPAQAIATDDPAVFPAACATCGQRTPEWPQPMMAGGGGPGTCATCGSGGGMCTPGRPGCSPNPFHGHTFIGRLFGALYDCICCPDPCYEPRWVPEANAAYFVDWARPQTITRIRVDNGINMNFPDRATYFWARADGKGVGPRPPTVTLPIHPVPKTGPKTRTVTLKGQPSLDYHELSLYQEAASARASFFISMPYRLVEPYYGPSHSGFSDMFLGTKSLLLDCELLQLTFQFTTYIPIGNTINGLGVGHVSLEPSLLSSLKLTSSTYAQGQLSEWIPLGGDPAYSGSILHYHFSLNQVLHRFTPDSPLIATTEFNGWSFQDGAYTDPYRGPHGASGYSYFSLGPGLRMVICNQYDFGVGTAFALSGSHWADTLYRVEFRIRF